VEEAGGSSTAYVEIEWLLKEFHHQNAVFRKKLYVELVKL